MGRRRGKDETLHGVQWRRVPPLPPPPLHRSGRSRPCGAARDRAPHLQVGRPGEVAVAEQQGGGGVGAVVPHAQLQLLVHHKARNIDL